MNFSKRNILTLAAIALLVAIICVALVACDTSTPPPDDHNGGNAQADITTITSLDEILSALGNDYKVSEKVLASAQRKYGSALAVLKSENADGTGELLVGTDEDGALKAATTSLSLSAGDFTARVFKSGTFTKTGDKISYYQGDKKQEEDISGAFTKTAENGDLTVIDATKADQKISVVLDNVTLEESGLNTEITNTDKEIFALVVGNAISEDKEVFLPSLICDYNSMTDKTEVEAVYYLDGKIVTCTVSFAGDLTTDGFNKDEAQNQIYKETATVATAEKDCTEFDGYSTLYCKTFASMTVEKVPSAQDLEETITFSSWDEVFNVFGEENSDLVKNKLSEILTEKLFNEKNVKSLFGNTCSLESIENKEIEMLKWAFDLTDNEITSIQVLGIRKNLDGTTSNRLQNGTFLLGNAISYEDVYARTKVKSEIVGEYTESYKNAEGNYTVIDFTKIANNLEETNINTKIGERKTYTPADEEGEKIFNLLMPYAVSEKTPYSHVSVSYSDVADIITVYMDALNEKTNVYEQWTFYFNRKDDETPKEDESLEYFDKLSAMMDRLLKQEKYENLLKESKMISGDIIFILGNGNQDVIEISPLSQQSAIEKQ